MPVSDLDLAAGRLDRWFEVCPSAAVAFSGGVDSALVVYWARRCLGRERCTAWTADSPSLKRNDLKIAQAFCTDHDIALRLLKTREIDDPNYASNPINRCFHCKSNLYQTLLSELARARDTVWVCSGANLDDQGDYRPGLVAAAHASVRHPLLECGIGKETIRALAKHHGLRVWDKPASPCLSSRIPYGQPVTAEKLARIEAAEAWMLAQGFPVCRVRHHGETARIEVPANRIQALELVWPEVRNAFAELGFASVELDDEGFVSGKLNRAIGKAGAKFGEQR
jgi:uncharacterized protein